MKPPLTTDISNNSSNPAGASTTSRALRRCVATELAVLGVCTPLFLLYAPRDAALYMALAALFVCYVFLTRRHTAQHIWGAAATSQARRLRQSVWQLALFTALNAALFAAWGIAHSQRVSAASLLIAVCLYFPWALLQQGIFQFYLHGRLRVLLGHSPPWLPALLSGVAYGTVHFPNYELMLLTSLSGTLWGLVYQRDRLLWPIALSHAVLGSAYYHAVVGEDLVANVMARLMPLLR
ncbi:MAG: CPBP family glutamic-type intramembrane protease [Burkholderiales bacterium]